MELFTFKKSSKWDLIGNVINQMNATKETFLINPMKMQERVLESDDDDDDDDEMDGQKR